MQPFQIDEIPLEIIMYIKNINSIRFPRQGYTSDVGIIESDQGIYVLKRAKGKLFCSWLKKEISILKCLTNETNLPVPNKKVSMEQKRHDQCWALMDFLEGETLRLQYPIKRIKTKEEN